MTITFGKDALPRRYIKYNNTIKTVEQKKANSSPLDAIFNITALRIAVISCEHNPTARSEKARLRNSFLTVFCIFIKAQMTKRFPRVATRENAKFKTQKQLTGETSPVGNQFNGIILKSIAVLFSHCLTCYIIYMYLSWIKLIPTLITPSVY